MPLALVVDAALSVDVASVVLPLVDVGLSDVFIDTVVDDKDVDVAETSESLVAVALSELLVSDDIVAEV